VIYPGWVRCLVKVVNFLKFFTRDVLTKVKLLKWKAYLTQAWGSQGKPGKISDGYSRFTWG